MKLEVVGSSIFMVETELVAYLKTFVSLYQTYELYQMFSSM